MDIIGQAAWVAQLTNIEYFKHILAAFQDAAVKEGFRFCEGTETYVLSERELETLGRAVIRARSQYLAPRALNAELERWTEKAVDDGEGVSWVDAIVNALQKREIVLERVHQPTHADTFAESHTARIKEFFEAIDEDALFNGAPVHKSS
jgi:hypothetical protein